MTSPRDAFVAVLDNGPLLQADAIVVLGGQDGEVRTQLALQLFKQGAAPLLVVSGGLDEPPRYQGARTMQGLLLGQGVDPLRVVLEAESRNTREQAVAVLHMAKNHGWRRLLLVASAHHIYRAFLTFVRHLNETGQAQALRLIPVAANHAGWWSAPAGWDETRIELLAAEYEKITGLEEHVATYAEGLAYLEHWEKAPPEMKAA